MSKNHKFEIKVLKVDNITLKMLKAYLFNFQFIERAMICRKNIFFSLTFNIIFYLLYTAIPATNERDNYKEPTQTKWELRSGRVLQASS